MTIGRNVVVWDGARRDRVASAHPLSNPSHVAFSPSGREIVVKNTSGDGVVLDPTTLAVVLSLGGRPYGEGSSLAFTHDGMLIDGSWSGHLLARDVTTGTVILDEHERRSISCVATTPDRTLVAYSEVNPTEPEQTHRVCLRESPFAEHEPVTLYEKACRGHVTALALTSDLLAVAVDNQLQVRALATGDLIASRDVSLPFVVSSLAWWPHSDTRIVAARTRFAMLDQTLQEHWAIDAEYACHVAIANDGTRALLGTWQGSLLVEPT